MLDTSPLSPVATQLMSSDEVEAEGQRLGVRRISRGRLRMLVFMVEDRRIAAIEQNPDKPSQWGQLARAGHQVAQFKDCATNRFVAVAVDGKVTEPKRIRASTRRQQLIINGCRSEPENVLSAFRALLLGQDFGKMISQDAR